MKRYVRSAWDPNTAARRMFSERAKFNERIDDHYPELLREMDAEAKEQCGSNWESYVPSRELRLKARSLGYRLRKVRAKGAFPYAIEPIE